MFAVLLTASACLKTEPDTSEVSEILLQADVPETKAMLENSTLNTVGNRIMVYDIFKDVNSSTSRVAISTDAMKQSTGWQFVDSSNNQMTYYWTLTGTHKFYSWLSQDVNMDTLYDTPEEFLEQDSPTILPPMNSPSRRKLFMEIARSLIFYIQI